MDIHWAELIIVVKITNNISILIFSKNPKNLILNILLIIKLISIHIARISSFFILNIVIIYVIKNNNLNTFFTDYTSLQFYLSFPGLSILSNLYSAHFLLILKLLE